MPKPKKGKPKGVLNPNEGKHHFDFSRFFPPEDLQYFLEHFWIVEWDLGKDYYEQGVLSYPSVHLAFERGKTMIYGVVTGKFSRRIEGVGKVLGIKFRPGGFYPFYQCSVASFSDSTIPIDEVFDVDAEALEDQVLRARDNELMVERAVEFIRTHLPEKDERVQQVNEIVNAVIDDSSLIRVGQLTEQFDIGERSLQRLFRKYVGVSPKWVIKRYRLHEVAGRLVENGEVDWSELALELGYYDQAHFIRDFKSIVGQTPTEYARSLHSSD
ncbi:helix-turn-helix domain-containing protein [Halalkalibaculum sp. DA384]|uniref:helix-turn-helix domain-containing protein n=1 Tax=Halalkalibaculum sp. DA384 TaxID=3373606 RepID=UPI0037546452